MKIACWGYYGKKNLGDDLILAELLKYLKEYAPEAAITVFASTPNVEMPTEGGRIHYCPRSTKELFCASLTQDLLICGPGGLMPQRSTFKLLLWTLLALIMKIRRRSLLFLGLGIGQQNFQRPGDRMLLRLIVRLSRAFVVRQNGVNDALKTNKIREAADVVFGMLPAKVVAKEPKSIVFSLANVFGNATDECNKFVEGMVKTIEDLMDAGYTIHFVEFTQGNDMYLYQRILAQLPATADITVHPYNEDSYTMTEIFQRAELCVCMRFHSLVLAAVNHTPCCIISYSDKMDDVAQRLCLTDYAVQICPISELYYGRLISFDERAFANILRRLITEKEAVKKQLERMVPALQRKAQENWEILSKVIALQRKSK